MYQVSLVNEMNIYEGDKNIFEYPVNFDDYNEAVKHAKPFVDEGHTVAIIQIQE